MSIIVRTSPDILAHKQAIPFKLFIPRELERDPAFAGWEALRALETVTLGDPFAAPGISTCFPGVIYTDETVSTDEALALVAAAVAPATEAFPVEYEDAWIEAWMPDAFEPVAEALDVTDLTQG